ncbi:MULTISPECIES: autotransporter domain-containing protein [unclassified Beijerinckia]|uniref:autotransporter domain-containing protein n=1 Tax=unclassified Beijerinckia TaxID=2638183 RepID=UPI00147E868E|nr:MULTISPECIES: autotransporter domain-containing protein [unclassified Beijerinckia]
MAGQLPATAFQNYDPSAASGIVAGPLALYTVHVNDILPTQLNLGFAEVGKKVTAYDLLTAAGVQNDLLSSLEPVVIGPGGKLYLTNGHHTFTSLQQSVYGASNPSVYVNVIANYSNLTEAQFWAKMQSSNFLLPLDNGVVKSVDPLTGAPIPSSFSGMTNDPYRGLEYSILKNKGSKLFDTASNISGAVGSTIPGLDKTAAFYSDFIWANAYRYANNGLGLAYLSPGDILLATQWNLNGANVTKLQQGGADVTVAQLPGYILPAAGLNISSVIDTATVNSGALDGYGTFTGLRGLNLGTVTIGTPDSTTGLILQLGADRGGKVTLSGNNTYTGGTTILAGTLIISSDANLGAASPSNLAVSSILTADDVRAANGIVFNSLSEGKGTLQINSSMTFNRPIGAGGEVATINPNGNIITLTGPIISLDNNATGFSDLSIGGSGTVVLAPTAGSNPNFYGNWIVSAGTFQASSDAALGNTSGPAYSIGQIILDGGTFKPGASFSSVRSVTLTGGSVFDTNGFNTSFAGVLTDVQRRLDITNSSATSNGAVTFGSLNISGSNTTNATGATSTLRFVAGAGKNTAVTLTNGVTRTDRSTLFIQPSTATSLGTSEFVYSGAPALTNTMAPAWMISNTSGADAYDFLTYGPNGYVKATYTKAGSGASGGINDASTTVPNAGIVEQTNNGTIATNRYAYALKVDSKATVTINASNSLTLGDGVNPAGLILGGSSSNTANIMGGKLIFGGSEGIIYSRSTAVSGTTLGNTISSEIVGTNGLTIAGEGMLTLSTASPNLTGWINVDSGMLNLTAANAFLNVSGVNLSNVKSNPAPAGLTIAASNAFSSLNSGGSNSTIKVSGANTVLTIGQTNNTNAALNNLDSTISSTITATDVAAGSAAIVKVGTGMLDLSGATMTLTTGSNIAVNAGTLRVSASSFTNTNNIVTSGASEVQFAQNGGGKFAGNVTGTGVLHLIGGTLQLTGTGNTYSGGTIVEQGSTLDLTTANVSSGNANIINAGGLIVFDQASSGIYSGVISDGCQMQQACTTKLAGSLVKDDSTGGNGGNVTIAAVQTYTGGTFVEAGTLTLGVGDAVASSAGVDLGRIGGGATATLALTANNTIKGLMSEKSNTTMVQLTDKTLTVNTASGQAWDFGGAITGTGNFAKSGAGVQILSGASSYTGTTTVDAGVLRVDGSIASSSLLSVNNGATLAGNGTVGNTIINAGGNLAAGNSIGTLTVQGDLTFMRGSTYQVEVSPTSSDRVNVSGIATLNGASVAAYYDSGAYITKRYTVLNAAGGVSGTFSGPVNTNLPSNFSAALDYDHNNAYLDLTLNYTPPGPTPPNFGSGLTGNQASVANALVNSFNTSGGIPLVFGALGPSGLSQASGESATGVQQATLTAMDRFLNLMTDPYSSGRTVAMVPMSYAPLPRGAQPLMVTQQPRWSVWGASYGGTQTTRGQALTGTSTAINGIFGVVAGADYRATPDTVIGFALGGGGTSYRLASGAGSGSANMFQAGLYGRQTFGSAYVAGSLAYGWQDVTTDRRVMFDQLRARFNASAFSGRLEGGYRLATPFGGVTPYAAGQFTNIALPNYSEQAITGPGLFALNYGSKSVTAWRSELGLRSDTAFEMGDATLTLRGRLAWAHNYNPNSSISASFLNLPASGFTVNGAAAARNAALVSAGAEMKWQGGLSIAATFEGEFSGRGNSYAGKGTLRYQW